MLLHANRGQHCSNPSILHLPAPVPAQVQQTRRLRAVQQWRRTQPQSEAIRATTQIAVSSKAVAYRGLPPLTTGVGMAVHSASHLARVHSAGLWLARMPVTSTVRKSS